MLSLWGAYVLFSRRQRYWRCGGARVGEYTANESDTFCAAPYMYAVIFPVVLKQWKCALLLCQFGVLFCYVLDKVSRIALVCVSRVRLCVRRSYVQPVA